jgi:hypothetical protein
MSVFWGLILEYLTILSLGIKSLFATPSKAWSYGTRGNIILVPGFFESWSCLATIGNHLNHLGFRVWPIADTRLKFASLSLCAEIVNNFISHNKLSDVVLVSHSKGGLIAHKILSNPKIVSSISLATPYGGTLIGCLYFGNLWEMRPPLNLNIKYNHKVFALYPTLDNHVLPNKNLLLPGAHNIQIDVVGHTRILTSAKTLATISQIIHPLASI